MRDYQGLFVRDQLGQLPNQPGTTFSMSPDIITSGAQPAPDASQFVTPDGYATDFGANVILNQPNFVYLRALNTDPAIPTTGRAWFYYTESDLALWPTKWRSDSILVDGNAQNYQDIAAAATNQACQPNSPFVWTPPLPASNTHYCCVSWMENPPVSSPPQDPILKLPPFATFDDLVNFILSHPNMGWRNEMNVAGLGATWSLTTNIAGPASGEPFLVGVQCTNMPTDGQISFSIPGPIPSIPAIIVPMSPIQKPELVGHGGSQRLAGRRAIIDHGQLPARSHAPARQRADHRYPDIIGPPIVERDASAGASGGIRSASQNGSSWRHGLCAERSLCDRRDDIPIRPVAGHLPRARPAGFAAAGNCSGAGDLAVTKVLRPAVRPLRTDETLPPSAPARAFSQADASAPSRPRCGGNRQRTRSSSGPCRRQGACGRTIQARLRRAAAPRSRAG